MNNVTVQKKRFNTEPNPYKKQFGDVSFTTYVVYAGDHVMDADDDKKEAEKKADRIRAIPEPMLYAAPGTLGIGVFR